MYYAYLQDVPSGIDPFAQNSGFQKSRWFKRGWTLQELLAPRQIEFYASDWTPVFASDTKGMLGDSWLSPHLMKIAILSGITHIPGPVLRRDQ